MEKVSVAPQMVSPVGRITHHQGSGACAMLTRDKSSDTAPSDREDGATPVDWRSVAAFAALILTISVAAIIERWLNQQLPPFWLAGTRFALAGMLSAGLVGIQRLPLPRGRALGVAVIFGLLQFGLGYALLYWGLQALPASLSSMILASVPLFTLLSAVIAGQETLKARGLIGALIALGGIAVLIGGQTGGNIPLLNMLAVVGTAICFSIGGVLLKSAPPARPASMSAVSMLIGAPLLLAMSAITGETSGGLRVLLPTDPALWLGQAYLVLAASMGVYFLTLYLLRRWPASTVSYQSVLIPPMTTLLSIWLLHEPVSGNLALGGALILSGVYLGALAKGRS